jgi:hypothetical protein
MCQLKEIRINKNSKIDSKVVAMVINNMLQRPTAVF